MSKNLDPSIIRVGDYVRVIKPDMFVRCGYPMSKKQAIVDIKKLFGNVIEDLIYSIDHGDKFLTRDEKGLYPKEQFNLEKTSDWKKDRCLRDVLGALAHRRLIHKRYGGNERSVHTEVKPDLINRKAKVVAIKFVQSGYYNAGYSGFSYEGEWDGYPPYLSDNKTHKILQLDFYSHSDSLDEYGVGHLEEWRNYDDTLERIEAINVRKISEKEFKTKDKIINPIDRLEVI